MIEIYQTTDAGIRSLAGLSEASKGSWINLVAPSHSEIAEVASELNVDSDYLTAPLDEDERSRIDQDEDQTLIIVNFPTPSADGYETWPLGIVLTDRYLITVVPVATSFLADFAENRVKSFVTHKKGRCVLQFFFRISTMYMTYLRQINRRIDSVEYALRDATRNQELIRLLTLNKSLVYFSTTLRANTAVLERIERIGFFRIFEEDLELLEDTKIENRQAMEMSTIYSNILAGTMDTYASIISNNLNGVMRFLTAWTILIALPTLVASIYGMNIPLPLQNNDTALIWILLVCLSLAGTMGYFLVRKRYL
jgi:magnesium transporter